MIVATVLSVYKVAQLRDRGNLSVFKSQLLQGNSCILLLGKKMVVMEMICFLNTKNSGSMSFSVTFVIFAQKIVD